MGAGAGKPSGSGKGKRSPPTFRRAAWGNMRTSCHPHSAKSWDIRNGTTVRPHTISVNLPGCSISCVHDFCRLTLHPPAHLSHLSVNQSHSTGQIRKMSSSPTPLPDKWWATRLGLVRQLGAIDSIPNPVPTNFQTPGNKTPHARIIAITQSNIHTSKIVLHYVNTTKGKSLFTQKTEGSFEMQRVYTLYIELRRSSKAYINRRPPRRRCIIRKTRVSRSENPNRTLISNRNRAVLQHGRFTFPRRFWREQHNDSDSYSNANNPNVL